MAAGRPDDIKMHRLPFRYCRARGLLPVGKRLLRSIARSAGWLDGLGAAPADLAPADKAEASEDRPNKKTHLKKQMINEPIGEVSAASRPKPQAGEGWAQQEDADRADELKLKKQLRICSNC